MCNFPRSIVASSLLAAWTLTACVSVPLSTTPGVGPSSTILGPDSVRVEQSASTLPARIKAGLTWLWSSYAALQAKGALPGLDDLRADILDIEVVVSRGDLMAALDLYGRARSRVTAIAAEVGR